jgi:hypothetical protein
MQPIIVQRLWTPSQRHSRFHGWFSRTTTQRQTLQREVLGFLALTVYLHLA